jgi:SAM-dependent methyltransferase
MILHQERQQQSGLLAQAGTAHSSGKGGTEGWYGVDVPYVPILSLLASAAAFVAAGLSTADWTSVWACAVGLVLLGHGLWSLKTSIRGKFHLWDRLISQLELGGAEAVLDVGCGRGLVLITVARRLTTGRATGVDPWRTRHRSGVNPAITRSNSEGNGVADRIDLQTADLTRLPFPDASFAIVTSNLSLRRAGNRADRRKAIQEIVRVTTPGGRIVIVDFRYLGQIRNDLMACGALNAVVRSTGPVGWFGSPFLACHVVMADRA